MKKNLLLLFFIVFFYGCGGGGGAASASGGGSNSTDTTIDPLTPTITYAALSDSLIDGVEYRCGDSISGLTGQNGVKGSFQYKSDCIVEFYIGKIKLGDINGSLLSPSLTVYPADIITSAEQKLRSSDINDTRVKNFARLIQSLDSDDNVSLNGITIDQATRENLNAVTVETLDLSVSTISSADLSNTLAKAFPTRTLKTETEAINHLKQTLNTNGYDVSSTKPAKPYMLNPITLQEANITQITSTHITKKTFLLHGEPSTSIWVAFDKNVSANPSNYINSNLKITSNWTQSITLDFSDINTTSFNYFIKLQDAAGNFSDPFKISINKDTIPPHVENRNIIENVLEEQLLFRNINATDIGGIKSYRIVTKEEDTRSTHDSNFTINSNGTITFKTEPNFDDNINAIFKVVARAVDWAGNMTDLLLQVILQNILDNPPKLTAQDYNTTIFEGPNNGDFVFNVSTTLETNLTIAPDNNITLSPIYYNLHNHTDIFEINRTTGIITIKDKDANTSLFDFEQLPNSIELNISVENNNSHPLNDINTTYATLTVNIANKIDTTPSIIPTTPHMSVPEHNASSGPYPIGGILKHSTNNDADPTMIFSINSGNDGNFTIDSSTGIIYAVANNHLDFETTPEYNLTIRATNTWWDGNTTANFMEVVQKIKIEDTVDNPPVITLKTLTNIVPESTVSNTQIATFEVNGTIYDANVTTSYTIDTVLKDGIVLTAGSHPFDINATNGTISTQRQLVSDYNENLSNLVDTVFTVKVKAQNLWWNGTYNYSNIVTFDLNVTNVVDNPPVLPANTTTLSFDENISIPTLSNGTAIGTQIYDVNTSGSTYDQNNVTTFRIISGNSDGTFSIDSTTGVVTLAKLLDWETNISHTLGIQASNIHWDGSEHNSSSIQNLTINVNNMIESTPSITGTTTLNIHENIDIAEVIASIEINSTEEDKKRVDSFSIVGGNSDSKFEISDMQTDTVTGLKYVDLKIENTLDYETNNSYVLEINATNIFGSSTRTVNINVVDDIEKNLPLLVVGINFLDQNLTTFNNNSIDNYLENLIFGSLKNELQDYFKKVSKDKFYFKKADIEKVGLKNGILIVNINQTYNDSIGTDAKLKQTINLAMAEVDTYFDFNESIGGNQIDLNNDGNISKNELMLLFLVPGNSIKSSGANAEASTNLDILDTTTYVFDSKNINFGSNAGYIIAPENDGNTTIGLIAKYISSALFDFKHANGSSYVYDYYDLMGEGYKGAILGETNGTTPVHLSAGHKISQGWIHPQTLKANRTTDSNFNFYNTHDKDNFNVIKIMSTTPNKYYLLENRNQITDTTLNITQNYDNGFYNKASQIFEGGIAIWEVVENTSIKFIKLVNKSNDTDTLPTDLNSLFSFPTPGSSEIDSTTKAYNLGIKTK